MARFEKCFMILPKSRYVKLICQAWVSLKHTCVLALHPAASDHNRSRPHGAVSDGDWTIEYRPTSRPSARKPTLLTVEFWNSFLKADYPKWTLNCFLVGYRQTTLRLVVDFPWPLNIVIRRVRCSEHYIKGHLLLRHFLYGRPFSARWWHVAFITGLATVGSDNVTLGRSEFSVTLIEYTGLFSTLVIKG